MNIVFAGTPVFAAQALQAIIDAGFNVPLVLTQPDRPSGRGMKLTASPVKQVALSHNIAVAQPTSLKLDGKYPLEAAEARVTLAAVEADIMVVAAYGLILPADVLTMPKHGCINIHASLLPRWRGAAPIHRAIEAGDAQTGITLMQMDVGLDTGDMLAIQSCDIAANTTTATLHDTLATMGANMVVEYLQALQNGNPPSATPQPAEGITYAQKIDKAESLLNWTQDASILEHKIRAFDPAPGCAAKVDDAQSFKVWAAQVLSHDASSLPAGTIINVSKQGIDVACGSGTLRITEAQRAGGKRLPVAQFLDSCSLTAGMRLVC
ncbi:methionyl-tRNA formyltransferase [Hydromonas duriensis]|uniref:Methionyl-tRNA formyltransferase n=1 Tax=Hydromonas duriensis TaxID=1527608 RepID=A0A4R6YAJ6_9BURK|nr:methionyl-tRNA formyltransferase [Hydromonas duriensis]TDR32536.1 methionyl-tRNA formyltransferase [Hydromonas duriensis]